MEIRWCICYGNCFLATSAAALDTLMISKERKYHRVMIRTSWGTTQTEQWLLYHLSLLPYSHRFSYLVACLLSYFAETVGISIQKVTEL